MTRKAVALAFLLGGCGPSVSAIYEANIRFEHCYRLDLDERAATGHRAACWKEWSRRYTYGQTRDRLEYARRRIAVLSAGDSSRPELDLRSVDGGGEAVNVHASPPPLAATALPVNVEDAGAPDSALAEKPAGRDPPGGECVTDCRSSWQACLDICHSDAGPKRKSCKTCDSDYGRCVQRCYK